MLSVYTLLSPPAPCSKRPSRMSVMRKIRTERATLRGPALRLAHHEVAEHLHPRHGFQLFRIDEISVELDRVGFAEQLHEAAVFLDEVIRQCGDAESLLARAHQTED